MTIELVLASIKLRDATRALHFDWMSVDDAIIRLFCGESTMHDADHFRSIDWQAERFGIEENYQEQGTK